MAENDFKIPLLEELEAALRKFGSIDWNSIRSREAFNLIMDGIVALKPIIFYCKGMSFGSYIYRARSFDSFPGGANVSDSIFRPLSFSYPPDPGLNRANFSGQPVFYGADNLKTAILEIRNSKEPECAINAISCWKVKPGVNVKVRPFVTNLPRLLRQQPEKTFIGGVFAQYERLYRDLPPELADSLRMLDEFHDRRFTTCSANRNEYYFTAWLADRVMLREHRGNPETQHLIPDAILYKSVLPDGVGANFAIDRDFADKFLELKEVYLVAEHRDRRTSMPTRLLLSCGSVEKGRITWRRPTAETLRYFQQEHDADSYTATILESPR